MARQFAIAVAATALVTCSAAAETLLPSHRGGPALHIHARVGTVEAPRAVPADIPLDPLGFVRIRTPFTAVETPEGTTLVRLPHYQGPDGSYETPADLTDAINGVPCGNECSAQALARWGYRP